MNSVFLIKTPLQLLNAIEAKHHFKLNTKDCVLIIMGDRKSQPQILMLAKNVGEWGKVIVLNETPLFFDNPFEIKHSLMRSIWRSKFFSKSFFYVRRLNRIKKFLGELEYIFVGFARYVYMRHFVNVSPHKHVFLLDDGNATIRLAKERREGVAFNPDISWKKRLKNYLKKILQGVNDIEQEKLGFFTIYNVVAGERDPIVENKFDYVRSRLDSLDTTDDVFFLGSPLSETGIIGQRRYFDYLIKIKKYYCDNKIIYVAHRRESKEKLKKIENELALDVVQYNYPIEYQLAMIGPRPKVLASFFSSALDSCSLIFEDKLKIVSFKIDLEGSSRRDEIESIYNSYNSSNSNVFVETFY